MAKGGIFVLENPVNSMLENHPRFQWLCSVCTIYRHLTRMGDFNGESEKPLWLYTNRKDVSAIELLRPRTTTAVDRVQLGVSYVGWDGSIKYDGRKDAMKKSEAYPVEFGRAVGSWFHARNASTAEAARARVASLLSQQPVGPLDLHGDSWADGKLINCFEWLLA